MAAGKAEIEVRPEQFVALSMDPGELQEIIQENLGNEQINEFDLDRVTVPAGGGSTWEVPSADGDTEAVKEIAAVIIHAKTVRAYWPDKYEGGSDPPQCSSPDGTYGIGDPGGDCETCPFNQWDSDPGGPGKACKEMKALFLLVEGELLPIVLTLPPTSLSEQKRYFLRLASKQHRYSGVVTGIGLRKAQSDGGIEYSVATFRLLQPLEDEMRTRIRSYADSMRPAFERVRVGGEEAAEQPGEE
jgi:hypothetical protein